ncbi:MAG TPA: SUMF1/EgtB/PvdO family nonheme iron enzyme [Pyrinomonadaceae bacterium]|nr:SUMF1/EgtB/PvdO family nonheme iron enzyme [Pyrinomonadaceae bacterium]
MSARSILLLAVTILLASAHPRAQQPAVAAQSGAAGYHALVIGNNDYRTLPKLKTAEADAREVAAILKEFYGFETTLLVNATRQQIVSALSAYRRRLGPEANLLVYYAGHGINDKDADKAYWLPVDADRDDTSNWIIADEITTALKVVPARHVLVVSDSCYSGTLTRGLGESLPPPNEREQFIQRMMAGRSRTLMASGGDEPVADGGGGKHSVFAGALLRGLRDIDKPRFTAAELFRFYVEEPVAGRAQQTPEYNPLRNSGHESGDFVFVKLKGGGGAETAAVTKPLTGAVDPSVFELEFWNAIKDSSDPEEYKDYLRRYPNGNFAEIARRRAAGGRGGNNTASAPPPAATPTPASRAASPSARPAPKAGATFKNRAGVELVYVPAGSFLMGSTEADVQRALRVVRGYNPAAKLDWFQDELPQRRVTLAEGFYIGRHEVTQAQWRALMSDGKAWHFQGCDECPVENVSWNDAQVFIQRLNAQDDGFVYRLPTEAEWEYAARGGTTTDFAFGDRLTTQQANCGDNYPPGAAKGESRGKPLPVGSFPANGFGLYDMHGNVAEWVEDAHHDTYAGAPSDGSAWVDGDRAVFRVVRGGSFERDPDRCRSARRSRRRPAAAVANVGFRVVAVPRP